MENERFLRSAAAIKTEQSEPLLSENELKAAEHLLFQLLTELSDQYTAGRSSSVPVETAQELLHSLCFTLQIDPENWALCPGSVRALLQDPAQALQRGRDRIRRQLDRGRELWQSCCLTAPQIDNLSYRDTLKSIDQFWRRYQFSFFAHQIPCDIDYQLCLPVPERLQGVDYIAEYLYRLLLENEFLSKFNASCVISLLRAFCLDYRGLLINLYEPAAANAIGLTVCGDDPFSLNVSAHDRDRLQLQLEALSNSAQERLLDSSTEKLASQLQLQLPGAKEYLRQTAARLLPRIRTALQHQTLNGIFLSFGAG
ncbi:MAG: DUF6179 domain-containing protein [Firmicutes bacterium]|nr:DUF6179 domain-containing protein [Bacillota bacterium]